MPLVIDGVRAFEEREAGILRLEGRLQVGGIVDGVRVSVAGEHLERMREALSEIKGESVVPGVAVGELGIDAVERNGNAESAGEAESFCESDLRSVTARNQRRERRVGAGRAEEIKECRSCDDANRAGAVLAGITEPRSARGKRRTSGRRKRDAALLHTGGRDNVKRGNAAGRPARSSSSGSVPASASRKSPE